jgi:hypothetical protein
MQGQQIERQTFIAYFFSQAHHDVIANDGTMRRWKDFMGDPDDNIWEHPCANGDKALGTKIVFIDTLEEIDPELESYRATWPDAILGGFFPCMSVSMV